MSCTLSRQEIFTRLPCKRNSRYKFYEFAPNRLEVYLNYPDVAIDTNHLERALRVIALGIRNWMFCWTELGAKQVGMVQSLLVTCRLHDIDPDDYFVDVLQPVGQHPAHLVQQLTTRLWKELFAANPLRSDLQV